MKEVCRKGGLRVTPQKQEIFRVVASTTSHPRAQDIYEDVKKKFPNISFATVYDNLRKFKDLGLVSEMNCPGSCQRFDANMTNHHHIIDRETGRVMDVELDQGQSIPIPKSLKNESISDIRITYIV